MFAVAVAPVSSLVLFNVQISGVAVSKHPLVNSKKLVIAIVLVADAAKE